MTLLVINNTNMRPIMKRNLICGATIVTIACAWAGAASAQSTSKTVSLGKMTCAEFVALEEVYKPAVVYWATGVDKLGVRETDQMTIDTAHPVAGEVTEACKLTPATKVAAKIKSMANQGALSIYKGK